MDTPSSLDISSHPIDSAFDSESCASFEVRTPGSTTPRAGGGLWGNDAKSKWKEDARTPTPVRGYAERIAEEEEEEEDAYDDVEESIAADAALMDLDLCVGKVWDALPSNAMLILATGVGDSPRLRTLQERKWKRVQGIGPWGPWTEDADAELKRAAERCRAGVAFAAVKP